MPKKVQEKSALEIKRLSKKPGFHAVGGVDGLHLTVSDTLAASWILRKKVGNRRPDMGLGGYPDVTAAMARNQAREYVALIKQGVDPLEEKRAREQALRTQQMAQISFEQAAKECHQKSKAKFKNEKYAKQWIASLERHAFPVIGKMNVMDLETEHIHKVLEPIWADKPTVAGDVRRRIEKVISYTFVKKNTNDRPNPARWEGNLKELLITTAEARRARNNGTEKHHPALPYKQIKTFVADLQNRDGMGCRSLEFVILTAARSGEVRGATWGEIDWETNEWIVPVARMKSSRPHVVPLSPPAVALLKSLPMGSPDDLIFPAVRGGMLSDVTMTMQIRRMHKAQVAAGETGYVDPQQNGRVVTPHGFRSCFRDWFAEVGEYPNEMGELALAHVVGDKTEAAYRRGTMKKKRAKMMGEWADYCTPSSDVVPMRRKA